MKTKYKVFIVLAVIIACFFGCEGLNLRGEGAISINIQPCECTLEVYIDDSLVQLRSIDSLYILTELPAGKDAEINIYKGRYLDWDTTFEVQGKDTIEIEKQFTGGLELTTSPSGATIIIDGEFTSRITPVIFEVAIGSHGLRLEHSDAASYDTTIEIYYNDTTTASCQLNTDFADIHISSNPPGAGIWLDDIQTPYITDHELENVSTGEHTVTLKKSGYVDWDTTVNVIKDVDVFINATLEEENRTGNIQVNSVPNGAEIWLDFEQSGEVTNQLFKDQLVGSHHVRLIKDGYKDWEGNVQVNEGETSTIDAILEEGETPTGNLQVNSTPTGAAIWIDDANTSETTNQLFEDLSVRSYKVKLAKDGYKDWETTVEVIENQTTTIDAELEPLIIGKGGLHVKSEPDEAEIWLNGENTGKLTEHFFDELKTGEYEVELVKYGYKPWDTTVTVIKNENVIIDAELEEALGNLEVKSIPTGACIWLNSDSTGDTTDHLFEDLSVDLYSVGLFKDGYEPWDTIVSLIMDSTVTINTTLESVDTTGFLMVKSVPTGAAIWLDSINTGDTTDHLFENVAEGSHYVLLKKGGYSDWDTTVTVSVGETTTVSTTLDTITFSNIASIATVTGTSLHPGGSRDVDKLNDESYSSGFWESTYTNGQANNTWMQYEWSTTYTLKTSIFYCHPESPPGLNVPLKYKIDVWQDGAWSQLKYIENADSSKHKFTDTLDYVVTKKIKIHLIDVRDTDSWGMDVSTIKEWEIMGGN